MPHIIIEYSDNIVESITEEKLLKKIHDNLEQTKLFNINDVKSRIVVHSNYLVGDGGRKRGFVTLTLSILEGRDEKTKKMLSDLCLDILKEEFADSLAKLLFSITVQIKEIDKACYGKITSYLAFFCFNVH